MNRKIEKLKKDVLHEISEIDKILENMKSLNNNISGSNISINDKTAMAAYLMNFYNGIENIFKRIAKEYYITNPSKGTWHKDLLLLAANGCKNKPPIISKEMAEKLYDYLGFRHFFVHGYSF